MRKPPLKPADKKWTVSEILKARQTEKLAARPPKIDWEVVRIQLEQRRLQWEQQQAALQRRPRRSLWARVKSWIAGERC
jgi:hypothetical protein